MSEEVKPAKSLQLTTAQIRIVIKNLFHKCTSCGQVMQPLSTTCAYCRALTPPKTVVVPFDRVVPDSYFEHFEIRNCAIHKFSTVWFCVHPKADSQHEDLEQACTNCLSDSLNSDLK